MQNFRVTIDLSDTYKELIKYSINLIGYTLPFSLVFIEANDYDEACYIVINRLLKYIIRKDNSIEARILCRKIKRLTRIDKIEHL